MSSRTLPPDPPGGLIYAPEPPAKQRRKHAAARPVLVPFNPKTKQNQPKAEQGESTTEAQKARLLQKEKLKAKQKSLERLINTFIQDNSGESYKTDIMKGVLAVAYLLETLSETGSKNVDSTAAQGFASTLRNQVRSIDRYLTEGWRLKDLEYELQKARESDGD